MSQPAFKTTDLCDQFGDAVQIAEPIFRDFGGKRTFCGRVSTVRVLDDNVLVRQALEEPGEGRVLVVDGAGSTRCALFGDLLAALGQGNGWAGVVIFGCLRDSAEIGAIMIGAKALATHPRRSPKRGEGDRDVVVSFAGVTFRPGQYLYADADGIIVADRDLLKE